MQTVESRVDRLEDKVRELDIALCGNGNGKKGVVEDFRTFKGVIENYLAIQEDRDKQRTQAAKDRDKNVSRNTQISIAIISLLSLMLGLLIYLGFGPGRHNSSSLHASDSSVTAAYEGVP